MFPMLGWPEKAGTMAAAFVVVVVVVVFNCS